MMVKRNYFPRITCRSLGDINHLIGLVVGILVRLMRTVKSIFIQQILEIINTGLGPMEFPPNWESIFKMTYYVIGKRWCASPWHLTRVPLFYPLWTHMRAFYVAAFPGAYLIRLFSPHCLYRWNVSKHILTDDIKCWWKFGEGVFLLKGDTFHTDLH